MTDLKKKNYTVELFRFLFCLIIIHYHFHQHYLRYNDIPNFFARSYLGDEFFFIVSGFFLSESALHTDRSPVDFNTGQLWKRLKKTALPYYLTWLLCFLGTHFYKFVMNKPTYLLSNLANSIYELSFLEVFGFLKGFYSNKLSWFFSALMVVPFLIGPFVAKYKQKFSLYIAPVISLVSYGMLSIYFDYLFRPFDLIGHSFVKKGLVRALAAICAGCFINGLVHSEAFVKFKANITRAVRSLIRLISVLLWILIICYMVYPFESNYVTLIVQYDYIVTFVMILALIPILGNLIAISSPRAEKISGRLGEFAFYAYFGQAIFYSFDKIIYKSTTISAWAKYTIMAALVTLFSLFLYMVDRSFKNRKKTNQKQDPTINQS